MEWMDERGWARARSALRPGTEPDRPGRRELRGRVGSLADVVPGGQTARSGPVGSELRGAGMVNGGRE